MHRTAPIHPALALLVALAALPFATPAAHAAETHAYVLTTDYSSPGGLAAVDLATRAVSEPNVFTSSDARVRWAGGLLYVVNRFGQDNVQVIDPAQGYVTVRQFSVGNGSNPQDIAVLSPTRAYVARLGSPRVLVVNPATGDSIGSIDLSPFADSDGLPEADRMVVVGSRLFVECQRLANFQPTGASVVAVIDTRTDQLIDADPVAPGVQAIALPGTNPTTRFDYDAASGRLVVGCTGAYGAADGGIAWVDPQALTSDGWAITESALGGDVLAVVWGSATRAFAIVSDAGFNTSLVAWNPATGQLLGTLLAPGGFSLADVALNDRGELYVCDNDFTAPGLYVLSAATGAPLTPQPLATTLPPVEVTFDQPSNVVGVPLPPAAVRGASTIALSAAWPQPATDGARARLVPAAAGDTHAEILDLAGRHVRDLGTFAPAAGARDVRWDLADDAGRRVRAGAYVMRASAGDASCSQRIVVIR